MALFVSFFLDMKYLFYSIKDMLWKKYLNNSLYLLSIEKYDFYHWLNDNLWFLKNILELNIALQGNINILVLDLSYLKLKNLLVQVMDIELLFVY